MLKRYQEMSEMQQKAVRVLSICLAAILLTTILTVTAVILTSGPAKPADDEETTEPYDRDAFVIDEDSGAILSETDDGGDGYLGETLFVGDSNTVRMYNYGLISMQQFVGEEGMGIQSLTSNACVYFANDTNGYTIPQAISMMKPRRIVITMGTNNVTGNMSAEEFISEYRNAVNAIRSAYPYCEIIVSAIPPLPKDHSNYPDLKMQTIDEFNQALLQMCEEDELPFLNISETLKTDSGFGNSAYFAPGDIHYSKEGIQKVLEYVRTHASDAPDSRPDTANIPARAQNPTAAAEPSAEPDKLKANYYAETGGYIDTGSEKSENVSFDVTEDDSITVTAVAKDGYVFFKWSDGVTTEQRTDKDFKQNLSVTAMFNSATYSITLDKSSVTIKETEKVTLKASVMQGNKAVSANNVIWTVNDEQCATASSFSPTFVRAGTYKVIAYYRVSDDKVISAECTVVVEAAETPTPTPTTTPTPPPAAPTLSIGGDASATAGETKTYTATVNNGDPGGVTWTVSFNGAEIARQTGGSITCRFDNAGNYVVNASYSGASDQSMTVVVNPASVPETPPEGQTE